jgi:hypothetical protein
MNSMKGYLFLLAFIVIGGGIYIYNTTSNVKKTYYDTGELQQETPLKNGLENGVVKEYYKNGAIKIEATFKDGKQDGPSVFYFPNGTVERRTFFLNGIQTDTLKIYYENGKIREISVIEKGLKNGPFKYFDERGELMEEGSLEKNLKTGNWLNRRDGIVEEYYNAGILMSKTVNGRYFHRNGYSILALSDWYKMVEKPNIVAFIPKTRLADKLPLGESISIVSGKIPDSLSFDQYVKMELTANEKRLGSFKVLSSHNENHRHVTVASFVYKGTSEGIIVRVMLSIYYNGEKLVVVSCLSPDALFTDQLKLKFNKVLSSFQFDSEQLFSGT